MGTSRNLLHTTGKELKSRMGVVHLVSGSSLDREARQRKQKGVCCACFLSILPQPQMKTFLLLISKSLQGTPECRASSNKSNFPAHHNHIFQPYHPGVWPARALCESSLGPRNAGRPSCSSTALRVKNRCSPHLIDGEGQAQRI